MKYIRDLLEYLKYKQSINELYSYSLKGKNGEQVGEEWNWRKRLAWWNESNIYTYEPDDENLNQDYI